MITLYGFKKIFPEGIGETKDLRIQWALEELGIAYRFHGLDHTAGDLDKPDYVRISPFHQVPVIDDDGFVVTESGAIVLYLADKAGKLRDLETRTRVTQWSFAAACTVAPTQAALDLIGMFDPDHTAKKLFTETDKIAGRWYDGLEHHLADREWIACKEFTVADIMMSCVLREIRKTDRLDRYPRVKAYYQRTIARPAWQRTLELSAQRLGVSVDSIR